MWGGQHAMMSPYGTPIPYPALYPPAGVYLIWHAYGNHRFLSIYADGTTGFGGSLGCHLMCGIAGT
ncbi:putative G-box binding protein, multifunctional mosaic region [Helianthus debilis subsp. tardiflorus]